MIRLHQQGFAHSFEVYDDEDRLIGGMYGIAIGAAFFGESMFSNGRDGSKIALTWALDHLKRAGFALFDTQFITAHLASLGAEEISRDRYMVRLRRAIDMPASVSSIAFETDRQAVVQRMTQTS